MVLTSLDLIVIAAYFIVLAAYGLVVRKVQGLADYSVAQRALPTSMVFASIASTYIGPGFAVGMTAKGFSSGLLFFGAAMLYVVQTILVGLVVAPRIQALNECHTVGDIFGRSYGKVGQVLAGVVSVGMCAGFAAVMARAGGGILSASLGWPLWTCIFLVTGVGVLYTYTGGLRSVVATEAMQFSIFAVAVPLVVFFVLRGSGASLDRFGTEATALTRTAAANMTPIGLLGLGLSFLLGETLIPPYVTRALASRSEETSRRGFLFAGLFGILWLAMVTAIGILAVFTLSTKPVNSDDVFMEMVRQYLPSGMVGLIVVALAAIVMSSQESVLNSGAVALSRDIIHPLMPLRDEQALRLSRIATLSIGILAGVFALRAPQIIDGLLVLYSIWAPTMLVPMLWAILAPRATAWSGLLAMLLGGTASIAWRAAGEPLAVPSILVGLAASLLGIAVGTILGSSRNQVRRG